MNLWLGIPQTIRNTVFPDSHENSYSKLLSFLIRPYLGDRERAVPFMSSDCLSNVLHTGKQKVQNLEMYREKKKREYNFNKRCHPSTSTSPTRPSPTIILHQTAAASGRPSFTDLPKVSPDHCFSEGLAAGPLSLQHRSFSSCRNVPFPGVFHICIPTITPSVQPSPQHMPLLFPCFMLPSTTWHRVWVHTSRYTGSICLRVVPSHRRNCKNARNWFLFLIMSVACNLAAEKSHPQ